MTVLVPLPAGRSRYPVSSELVLLVVTALMLIASLAAPETKATSNNACPAA